MGGQRHGFPWKNGLKGEISDSKADLWDHKEVLIQRLKRVTRGVEAQHINILYQNKKCSKHNLSTDHSYGGSRQNYISQSEICPYIMQLEVHNRYKSIPVQILGSLEWKKKTIILAFCIIVGHLTRKKGKYETKLFWGYP